MTYLWVSKIICLLRFSPDGYKLTHHEELKRYFSEVVEEEPPPSLDFLANFSLLPDLSVQQKNLPLIGPPKIW